MTGKYIAYIFSFLLLISCSQDPQEVNIYDIPDEFILDMHQIPTPLGTQPAFRVSTINVQPCENDILNAVIFKSGKSIQIDIRDIIAAQDCIEKSSRISVDLFAVMPPENYDFQVSLKDQIFNDGNISIQQDYYSLTMLNDHGIMIGKTEIKKIPDNHIWGYVRPENGENRSVTSLFDLLYPLLDRPDSLYSGDYGLFSIDSSGEIHFPDIEDNPQMEKFIMKTNATISELKAAVESYQKLHPEMDISVTTSFGIII